MRAQVDPDVLVVRRSNTARMNPSCFAIMIKAMQEKEHTLSELCHLTGLHEWTLRHYCKSLVLAQAAHICRWTKDALGRDTTPHYRMGFGINMPRERKTAAFKQRESRERARKRAAAINAQEASK